MVGRSSQGPPPLSYRCAIVAIHRLQVPFFSDMPPTSMPGLSPHPFFLPQPSDSVAFSLSPGMVPKGMAQRRGSRLGHRQSSSCALHRIVFSVFHTLLSVYPDTPCCFAPTTHAWPSVSPPVQSSLVSSALLFVSLHAGAVGEYISSLTSLLPVLKASICRPFHHISRGLHRDPVNVLSGVFTSSSSSPPVDSKRGIYNSHTLLHHPGTVFSIHITPPIYFLLPPRLSLLPTPNAKLGPDLALSTLLGLSLVRT